MNRVKQIARIGHLSDQASLVVHTIHPKNTATRIFPQTRLDERLIPEDIRGVLRSVLDR